VKLKLSSWAIANPLLIALATLILLIWGADCFHRLPVNGMPTVRIPVVSVSVALPGASSSTIERQVTISVENAVANIPNIKHVTSYIENGVSVTQIEFRYGTNIRTVLSLVREKVAGLRRQWPNDVGEPLIQQSEDDNTPLMTYAFQSAKLSLPVLTQHVDKELVSALMAIEGVEKIERQGGYDREIHIELLPEKLYALGVSAATVSKQIQAFITQAPAGQFSLGSKQTSLRVQGDPQSVDGLANLQIAVGEHRYATLSSLGNIRDTYKQAQQLTRLNRQPAIGIAIYRTAKADELKVAEAIEQAIQQWQQTQPSIQAEQVQTQIDFTKKTYFSALMSFLEGVLLAGLVVYAFLRSSRATLIAAVAIPLSVIPTFIVMHWLGFSLNLVSMLALSLVSGVLVDDAIVEIENIIRHMETGQAPYPAAMRAADEIGLAVIATSFAIIAVFVPVSFMGGLVGQYFIQFGITVATATFFSLLVARFITPVMAAYFLKPTPTMVSQGRWYHFYQRWLEKSLKHRRISLLLVGLLLLLSASLILILPADFMPQEDKAYFMLQVELPAEAQLKQTDAAIEQVTETLLSKPGVSSVYSWIGGRDAETMVAGQVNRATLIVKLVARAQRDVSVEQFKAQALYDLRRVPNVRLSALNENGSKAFGLVLTGNDSQHLYHTALALEHDMRKLPAFSNVLSTVPAIKSNMVVTPKPHEAARLGVSTSAIAEELQIALKGGSEELLAHVLLDNQTVPVRCAVRIPEQSALAFLRQLPVTTNTQQIVPLDAAANLAFVHDYASITRYDRMPQIVISADLNGISLGDAMQTVRQLQTLQHLPAGISISETGDSEMLSEMFSTFSVAMLSGLLLVWMVLVLLFRRLLQPFTIMMALPLSVCGALLALALTHQALSLPAVIGILMLMGIVGKNGILIVDAIIECRSAGLSRYEAMIAACQQRSRPIIMTTIAMIAGMLPVIIGAGAGTGFRTPMAYALIGGLVTSTLLSLIVVPLIYTLMDDAEQWAKGNSTHPHLPK
jgi:HAE1 family hydrophobic/amphiphilic exporter-1